MYEVTSVISSYIIPKPPALLYKVFDHNFLYFYIYLDTFHANFYFIFFIQHIFIRSRVSSTVTRTNTQTWIGLNHFASVSFGETSFLALEMKLWLHENLEIDDLLLFQAYERNYLKFYFIFLFFHSLKTTNDVCNDFVDSNFCVFR